MAEEYISRQHAISQIEDLLRSPWANDSIVSRYLREGVTTVRDLVVKTEEAADVATVVRAHLVNFAGDCQLLWQCSECECTTVPYWSKFCPNCGAKIEGDVTRTNKIPITEVETDV